MLNEAERHEPLTANAWNEQAARACIDEILSDAIDRFSARDLWPSHPLDSFSPDARWNLYIGAAGTIWALRHNDSVARGTRLNYFTNSSTLWCCGLAFWRHQVCGPASRHRSAVIDVYGSDRRGARLPHRSR